MNIGLIGCVKTKLNYRAKACDLYISDLFKKQLAYSIKKYDKVFILSAKHGLLNLNDIINPYELTLNNQSNEYIKKWSIKVFIKLKKETNINVDVFYFHCGEKYRRYLKNALNHEIPLKNITFGNQLKFYKENL